MSFDLKISKSVCAMLHGRKRHTLPGAVSKVPRPRHTLVARTKPFTVTCRPLMSQQLKGRLGTLHLVHLHKAQVHSKCMGICSTELGTIPTLLSLSAA